MFLRSNRSVFRFNGFWQVMLSFLLPLSAIGQKTYTLSGYVKDASNGETLIGVNVFLPGTQNGVATNLYGFYSLSLPEGIFEVQFQYLGYETRKQTLTVNADMRLDVSLEPSSTTLSEVEVTDSRLQDRVQSTEMSTAKLQVKEIQKVPQLLGEVDIVRTFTLLPGVTTVGEGASGFNVRGGNVDQNLILLDEAPVYNSSHLFGFFSIFNADAVKDVKLYKGGIPAQYGGRLSSVLDVRQKDGNNQRFGLSGGIGLLSSRLLLEGPIIKNKLSYVVAARRSYMDLFLRLSDDITINQTILYFYDLNAKVNYEIDARNKVYISAYFGRDELGLQDLFGFDWGNGTVTGRWNHLWNDRLFSNLSLVFSDYTYTLGTPDDDEFPFKWVSNIKSYTADAAFTWYPNNKHTVDFGAEATFYDFSPATITGAFNAELEKEYALEPSLYIGDEWTVNTRWKVNYGLRFSQFYNLGAGTVRTYRNGFASDTSVTDTVSYGGGEAIASFNGLEGLEPRLAVTYLINENQSVKFSYNRMRQYLHLISNTTAATPIDVWRPAGTHIDPATVNQIAVGYFHVFPEWHLEASIETYYKQFRNLVDYRDGADLLFQEYLETQLLTGQGRAYGLELLLRRQEGRLTGWLAYTLARTERQVLGDLPELTLNGGDWYPSNYDKTHDLSLVLSYTFSDKWEGGMVFNWQSGRPITYPDARFEYEGITAPVYSNRNGARTPDYHRLDLSATYTPSGNKDRKWKSSWTFGVYNAYARRNPYSIFFRQNPDNPTTTEAVRLSIFATIIPSVTYNFTF